MPRPAIETWLPTLRARVRDVRRNLSSARAATIDKLASGKARRLPRAAEEIKAGDDVNIILFPRCRPDDGFDVMHTGTTAYDKYQCAWAANSE